VTVGRPGVRPQSARTVTSATTIATIVALIDALPTVQPYTISCPLERTATATVTITFRASPGGRVLASAAEPENATVPTTGCDPMTLTIAGRRRTPLLGGVAADRRIERLVGIRAASARAPSRQPAGDQSLTASVLGARGASHTGRRTPLLGGVAADRRIERLVGIRAASARAPSRQPAGDQPLTASVLGARGASHTGR